MLVFYIELIETYIFSLYSRLASSKFKSIGAIFAFFTMMTLFLVSGLRKNIGDTELYMHSFNLLSTSYAADLGNEPGFNLMQIILKNISNDPQILLLVTAFVTNATIVWTLKKYSGYFEIAIYMYITSGFYLVTMNGIRQSMVAGVLFACVPLIIKGKFKIYILIVLLMTTFHNSAIVMIPIYFMVRNEAWSRKIYMLIALFLIGLVFYQPLMDVTFSALGNSPYGHYKDFNEGGANIFRVFVNLVPVALAYIKRKELKEKWPESDIFVNMSLLNLIIMCFALFNWIFARFNIYFEAYNLVLLSVIFERCTTREERNFLYTGFLVAYFIYFWYEQWYGMGIQYKSNFKLF